MKCFAPQIRKSKSLKPEVLIVENDHLLTERLALSWLDLRDATSSELESFTLREIIGSHF